MIEGKPKGARRGNMNRGILRIFVGGMRVGFGAMNAAEWLRFRRRKIYLLAELGCENHRL